MTIKDENGKHLILKGCLTADGRVSVGNRDEHNKQIGDNCEGEFYNLKELPIGAPKISPTTTRRIAEITGCVINGLFEPDAASTIIINKLFKQ